MAGFNSNPKKWAGNAAAVAFGCSLAVVLLLSAEYFFTLNETYRWLKPKEVPYQREPGPPYDIGQIDFSYLNDVRPYPHAPDFAEPDDYFGSYRQFECENNKPEFEPWWIGKPNCTGKVVLRKKNTGRVTYEAAYSYDRYARRKIPAAKKTDKFLMFLGCSFTFGEGVNDNETFASRLTEKVGNVNAYNLSMMGWGAHQTLRLLQKTEDVRTDGISGEGEAAIFTITSDHIGRARGTLGWFRATSDASQDPYYYLKGDELVYGGRLSEYRPIQSWLFSWMSKSRMLSFFNVDYPAVDQNELRALAATYREIKKILSLKYHVKTFVVATYPEQERTRIADLKPLLEKEGFIVLNFANVRLWEMTKSTATFMLNGHPSSTGHRVYADLLYHELNQRGIFPGRSRLARK